MGDPYPRRSGVGWRIKCPKPQCEKVIIGLTKHAVEYNYGLHKKTHSPVEKLLSGATVKEPRIAA